MSPDDKRKKIDLICLSKESVYCILLSNMAGHFCLFLLLIHDRSTYLEHQTNYVKNRPMTWYLFKKEKKQNILKSNIRIRYTEMLKPSLKCPPSPHALSFKNLSWYRIPVKSVVVDSINRYNWYEWSILFVSMF